MKCHCKKFLDKQAGSLLFEVGGIIKNINSVHSILIWLEELGTWYEWYYSGEYFIIFWHKERKLFSWWGYLASVIKVIKYWWIGPDKWKYLYYTRIGQTFKVGYSNF